MAAIAGKGGSVKITASNTVVEVKSWSGDIDGGLVDSHSLGDSWGESTQTILKGTFSIECKWDLPNDTNGQKALQDALLAGSDVTDLRLYHNATNYLAGNAKVESASYSTDVDDLVIVTFNVRTEGAWTYN